MKTYTPTEQKTKLEKALISALKIANEEINVLGPHYAEENLRYAVMTAISNVRCFGVFPNKNQDGYNLCFEKKYEKNTFKPDIVSLNLRANGKKHKVNKSNPLVIELKINASLTATDSKKKINSKLSKDIQKIKRMGSCLSTDIYKVRQYLKKVDTIQFDFGVVMTIGIPKPTKREQSDDDLAKYTYDLEVVLRKHQKEFRKEKNSSKNLLFAWFNPLINKPELFWLDQEKEIKLKGYVIN
jgi:hypothetical protein